MSRISISDVNSYKTVCRNASINENDFTSFRRNESYMAILEHVNEKEGGQYLKYIEKHFVDFNKYLELFKQNDVYGSPIMFQYPNIGFISPTTLRYCKVLCDLKILFGNLNDFRIVEIGCGYGGQCKIIKEYFKIKEYTLIDLPDTNMLINKYLSKNSVENFNITTLDDYIGQNNSEKEFDLVISNYAISEIREDIQMKYFEHIIKKSKRGYLTLNFIGHIFGINTLSKEKTFNLLREKFDVFEMKEEPLTESNNTIVYWKK